MPGRQPHGWHTSPVVWIQTTLTKAWTRRGPLAWLLWPVSLGYGLAVRGIRWQFREGLRATWRVPARVIVVGNVVAGGAGKTPVVMALVTHLQQRGLKVGVLSRGYGRTTTDCREVLPDSPAKLVGDEPALIKTSTGAAVFVARLRVEAARALLVQYPETQVIVCDDGLQHHALQRDLEICVFDDRGAGNGFLLPAGPLREPWPRQPITRQTTASRDDRLLWPPVETLILHTGRQSAFKTGYTARRTLAAHARRADGSSVEVSSLRGKPVVALAAIAQPEGFFTMLRDQGLTLAHTAALPDHFDFNGWSNPFDPSLALLCTEKDAVKLWQSCPGALAVPLILTLEPAFLAAVNQVLQHWKLASAPG